MPKTPMVLGALPSSAKLPVVVDPNTAVFELDIARTPTPDVELPCTAEFVLDVPRTPMFDDELPDTPAFDDDVPLTPVPRTDVPLTPVSKAPLVERSWPRTPDWPLVDEVLLNFA
jgi:hypothetical protein